MMSLAFSLSGCSTVCIHCLARRRLSARCMCASKGLRGRGLCAPVGRPLRAIRAVLGGCDEVSSGGLLGLAVLPDHGVKGRLGGGDAGQQGPVQVPDLRQAVRERRADRAACPARAGACLLVDPVYLGLALLVQAGVVVGEQVPCGRHRRRQQLSWCASSATRWSCCLLHMCVLASSWLQPQTCACLPAGAWDLCASPPKAASTE